MGLPTSGRHLDNGMSQISNGLWKENCVFVARSLSGFDEMPGLPSGSTRKADEDPDAKTSRGQAQKCHHEKKCPKGIAKKNSTQNALPSKKTLSYRHCSKKKGTAQKARSKGTVGKRTSYMLCSHSIQNKT